LTGVADTSACSRPSDNSYTRVVAVRRLGSSRTRRGRGAAARRGIGILCGPPAALIWCGFGGCARPPNQPRGSHHEWWEGSDPIDPGGKTPVGGCAPPPRGTAASVTPASTIAAAVTTAATRAYLRAPPLIR